VHAWAFNAAMPIRATEVFLQEETGLTEGWAVASPNY
jgi:hypothetical protein